MADRKVLRTCVLLFVAALAVRVAATTVFDLRRAAVGDEADYLGYAVSLARDHVFLWGKRSLYAVGQPWVIEWHEPNPVGFVASFRTPLLPLLMSPIAWLGGDLSWMRLANAVLGSLCAPFFLLALRRSPIARHAIWPAMALVVWPSAVFLSLQLLSEPLAMICVLGAIAVRPDTSSRLIPERQSFVAGVLGGFAILARPASLVTTAFLAVARGTPRRALWFILGASLLVAPWVLRNWTLHGRPLLTTNTGMTLVGSNCAAALDQSWPGKWVEMRTAYAEARDAPNLTPPELGWSQLTEEQSDRRFASGAWTWIHDNPGDFARLCFWKVVRLFDPDQHSNKPDTRLKSWVGWAAYAPVLLLALVGAWFAWKDRRAWAPWWALIAGTVLTTLVFHGDVRMRFPMDPALLAFATLAVTRLRSAPIAAGDGKT